MNLTSMRKEQARKISDMGTLLRVIRQARPYWPHVAMVFLLDLLAAPMALLVPLPLKIAVDSVVGDAAPSAVVRAFLPESMIATPSRLLAAAAVLLVVVAALTRLRSLLATSLRTRVGHELQLGFRATLFEHAQRLSLAYHDEKGTHDSTYRILYDTPSIQHLIVSALPLLIGALVTFMGMAYVTARISPQLAFVALTASPILLALGWWHRNAVKDRWTEVKRLEHRAFSIAQESFSELRIVKAFGQERKERDRFLQQSTEGMEALHDVQISESRFQLLIGLTTALGTGAVLYLGMANVLNGTITLGATLVVLSYLAQLYAPLESIGSQVTSIQNSLVMADRAFTLLDREPDVRDKEGAIRVQRVRGDIKFDNVSFSYRAGEPILEDISFSVPAGGRVGIAGRTGAGKTTLLNLLVRFYDPPSGRVTIDGIDLRDYRLMDLRDQFSIVLQDTLLFSVSIEENILYARPGATHAEVETAARAANAHDFITQLPDGYNTLVGQRGMRLSGGERQRISLARAFLRGSPILILDEPTSAVDIGTERSIIDAMERLMEGRTTFVVAHRLSSLEGCDLLLVLEQGRLITVTDDVAGLLREAERLGSVETAARQWNVTLLPSAGR